MMYNLINELVTLVKTYEERVANPAEDLHAFRNWLNIHFEDEQSSSAVEPDWAGKDNGRSADSVINTSLVHLYRYAKIHAKAAITDSAFSTPDEFIYLISLVSGGSMSKTELIKQNIHDKPAGSLIIKRLLDKGLIEQQSSDLDKRSRMVQVTPKGSDHLKQSMDKIRLASAHVTEPLSPKEKNDLITLLLKLEDFHQAQLVEKV
ncbi:winged helix-turn-helix transcriptional regulator [Agrobacterium tumefaciens]|nr:winged helix-turn-helix transcriptional regulator [Agrobacterium tumefaciens]NTE18752.1 winged helix-turn-helix transcriptional regulator [Agrobacterium tumefaciens]